MTAAEVKQLFDEGGVRLVDVREDYEFEEMRIGGAQLMPLSKYEGHPELLVEAPVTVFQCATGVRSQVAAEIYEAAHPGARAINLDGGIVAWVNAGFPFEMGPD